MMICTLLECSIRVSSTCNKNELCVENAILQRKRQKLQSSLMSRLMFPRICKHERMKVFSLGEQCWDHNNSESSGTFGFLLVDEEEPHSTHDKINNECEGEWSADQLDAIASLFRGTTPKKSRSQMKQRWFPLPMPCRPIDVPQSKKAIRSHNVAKKRYKSPEFLLSLAREIRNLPPEEGVSKVLDKWVGVLRKGSLSLTIRELGHMGLPQRALQTFCWAQNCPNLYPDDRVLGSTLEILARAGELKTPSPLGLRSCLSSCDRNSLECIARGFIKAGQCRQAREVLLAARDSLFKLDDGIHAKLIAQAAKSRKGHNLAAKLLEELGMRDNLKLEIQDCTVLMKGCMRLGMYEAVESLFLWWKESGHRPNVVMYTCVMHSRSCNAKFREALALVWEMEESNCLLDLPAYRVIIRVCAELGDLTRAVRHFSKMKDASFVPTHDIYNHLVTLYFKSGRLAKCKELLKEMGKMGFKPNAEILEHIDCW